MKTWRVWLVRRVAKALDVSIAVRNGTRKHKGKPSKNPGATPQVADPRRLAGGTGELGDPAYVTPDEREYRGVV